MNSAYSERPAYFESGAETLFGVATEPTAEPNGFEILTVCGGGWIPSFHRGSMWVRLARLLAEHGYRTFRFDYHGVGESTGTVQFALDRPLVADARAALNAFSTGDNTVLIGTCGGARAVAALGSTMDRLAAVALLAVPVRPARTDAQVVRAAFSWKVLGNLRKAASRREYLRIAVRRFREHFSRRATNADGSRTRHVFLDDLENLIDRGIPILIAYGEDDREYQWFREALENSRLGGLVAQAGDQVQVAIVEKSFHGFHSAGAQQHVIDMIEPWLEDTVRPKQAATLHSSSE